MESLLHVLLSSDAICVKLTKLVLGKSISFLRCSFKEIKSDLLVFFCSETAKVAFTEAVEGFGATTLRCTFIKLKGIFPIFFDAVILSEIELSTWISLSSRHLKVFYRFCFVNSCGNSIEIA